MTSITLGKFSLKNTCIHRLDPRLKVLGMLMFLVIIFLSYGVTRQNYLMYGFFFVILLFLMIISRTSFLQVFKSLKALWFMMLLLLVINALTVKSGEVWFYIYQLDIHYEAILRWGYIVIRLILMIMTTTLLTSTTKPMELTFALEWLLTPLKYIKVPVHIIAMTLSLALRFIPTLAEEADRIMRAQASRGIDFREGKFKEKFKAVISLIIPLFVSSLLRSGELADALEARGYDPLGKRTKYRKHKWNYKTTLGLLIIAIFLTGIILLAVYQFDFIGMIMGLMK